MKIKKQRRLYWFHLFIMGLVGCLIISWMGSYLFTHVFAQQPENEWSTPVNLSNSGSSSKPQMLIDSLGNIHVYWMDNIEGVMYTYRNLSKKWSEPVQVEVPFDRALSKLKLLPEPDGTVNAFWIDAVGNLLYSRGVKGINQFDWSAPQFITSSILGFIANLDESQTSHIVYVQKEGADSGIYYTAHMKSGAWLAETPIYTSLYYRNITSENFHFDIAVNNNKDLFLVFDEPYKEQVLTVLSTDNGKSWSEPLIIDQREETDSPESIGPKKGKVQIHEGEVVFLWQAGHGGSVCDQYAFSVSGEKINEVEQSDVILKNSIDGQIIHMNLQECPESIDILEDDVGNQWILIETTSGIQLSRWEGSEISPFQFQAELTSFTHPETYRPIELSDKIYTLYRNQLMTLGSSSGYGNDIWFLERPLGSSESWYPTPTPEPLWSTPAALSRADHFLSNPVLVTSGNSIQHALWSTTGGNINYSSFDGTHWNQPVSILTSPGEVVGDLSVAVGIDGNLILVWDNPELNELFISWANQSNAIAPGEWIYPLTILGASGGRSPDVSVSQDGSIYVAYSVPLNENRGIYLIKSHQPLQVGEPIEWDSPVKIFDGVSAGWSMVGSPELTLLEEGNVIIQWEKLSSPPSENILGLYSARFADSVISDPEEIKVGEISWSKLVSGPEGYLHRVWHEIDTNGRLRLWHQYSADQGLHWSDEVSISTYFTTGGVSDLLYDKSGYLHLIVISESGLISLGNNASLTLQDWIFTDGEWNLDEQVSLEDLTDPISLQGSSPDNRTLAALFAAGYLPDNSQLEPQDGLFYSERPINWDGGTPVSLPTLTPQPTAVVTEEPGLSPTPVLVFSVESGSQQLALLNNRIALILLGGIPAGVIVIFVIIRGVRKRKS